MEIIASAPAPVRAAAAESCPISESTRIRYGFMKLFWYRVREVGMPLSLGEGWLVPVRYGPFKRYVLLHYRFGRASALRFDEIIEVMPDRAAASWYLYKSASMPRILSADRDKVVIEAYEEVDASDVEYAFHGEEKNFIAHKVTLYGILGPRNGRCDTCERMN